MKNAIFAAMMAVAFLPAANMPSNAASVTVTTTTKHHDNGLHRGRYEGKHYGWRHEAHRHCMTKKVKVHRNGKLIVTTKRFCR